MTQRRVKGEGSMPPPATDKPKWVDLFGIDPDYTGGIDPDEWLEQQRGEA